MYVWWSSSVPTSGLDSFSFLGLRECAGLLALLLHISSAVSGRRDFFLPRAAVNCSLSDEVVAFALAVMLAFPGRQDRSSSGSRCDWPASAHGRMMGTGLR